MIDVLILVCVFFIAFCMNELEKNLGNIIKLLKEIRDSRGTKEERG